MEGEELSHGRGSDTEKSTLHHGLDSYRSALTFSIREKQGAFLTVAPAEGPKGNRNRMKGMTERREYERHDGQRHEGMTMIRKRNDTTGIGNLYRSTASVTAMVHMRGMFAEIHSQKG